MKRKILYLCFLMFISAIIPDLARAEPAIIKKIVVDTQNSAVKISITSSKPVPIETFKSQRSPTNYIVLDFMGVVYTDLPLVIEVNQGAVEKVSLIRGGEKEIQVRGNKYYSLDFLAINLNTSADYRVAQSKSVIDLNIATTAGTAEIGLAQVGREESLKAQKVVELEPPIIVSRKAKKKTETRVAKRKKSKKREKRKAVKRKKKKKKKKSAWIFGRTKKTAKKSQRPEPKTKKIEADKFAGDDSLMDQIVEETIREKEKAVSRIEDLTTDLRVMEKDLNYTKGEKVKIENKINEILAKLDELKSALDAEISRRKSLGEEVDDLVAKRDAYVQAKKAYLNSANKLADISDKVDGLDGEVNRVKSRLEYLQSERKKFEAKMDLFSLEYANLKLEYEKATKLKEATSTQIDELTQKLAELEGRLDEKIAQRKKLLTQLKKLGEEGSYRKAELSHIKDVLADQNAEISILSREYSQIKQALENAVSQKFKIEYAYRNAKRELEATKKKIEGYLKDR